MGRHVPPRNLILVLAGYLAAGCGPMFFPAVVRLPPEEQAVVDHEWDNMLSPPGRLDRGILLDALVENQLHYRGVDRLSLHGEKAFVGGKVVMDMRFDRAHLEADTFTIAVYDPRGRRARLERYTGAEVIGRCASLSRPPSPPTDEQGNPLPEPPEDQRQREEYERRIARIIAATQPGQ